MSYRADAIQAYYPTHEERDDMNRIEFSMHPPTGLVTLDDIAHKLPENNWTWHVLHYYGFGAGPNGMAISDFEKSARTEGYPLDWLSLRRFANETGQTIDCLIAALDPKDMRRAAELVASDCHGAYVIIEAFDSSTWTVRSRDALPLQEFLGS